MTRITKSRNLIVAYTVPKLKDFSPAALDKAAERLLAALKKESADNKAESDWKSFRDRWMARKNGVLTLVNDFWLKAAPKENKRGIGQRVNKIKQQVEQTVDSTLSRIQGAGYASRLSTESINTTLPRHRRSVQ